MNVRLIAVLLCLLSFAMPVQAGQVGTLFTFTPKTVIESVKVNYNFSALLQGANFVESDQIVDSTITGADIASHAVTLDNLDLDITTVEVGTIVQYAGDTAPTGWLLCNGDNTLSKTIYYRLYGVVGGKFGAGSDPTTFALPDLRARVPVGYNPTVISATVAEDTRSVRNIGDTGGVETHKLTEPELASHTQGGASGTALVSGAGPYDWPGGGASAALAAIGGTSSSGNDVPHINMQPFVVVNYIIYTGRR